MNFYSIKHHFIYRNNEILTLSIHFVDKIALPKNCFCILKNIFAQFLNFVRDSSCRFTFIYFSNTYKLFIPNNMLKQFTLSILLSISLTWGFAQKKDESKSEAPQSIDTEIATRAIMQRINKLRIENNIDTLLYEEMLIKASVIQAEDMAAIGKASLANSKAALATTGDRVASAGGTKNAEEIVVTLAAVKGKDLMPISEIVDEAIKKWGKKEMPIILNSNFVYIGASMRLDATGKKAFISVVFSGLKLYNNGASKKQRKQIKKPRYTTKDKIAAPDKKTCKNCDKFSNYEKLLEGVYVDGKYVYIKYDDVKELSKLLKGAADGLTIDIVQKSQYEKPDYNITNYSLQHKGIIKKTVGLPALLAKNRYQPENEKEKINKLDAPLAKLPKKLKGVYEINLLVVQEGTLCKTLIKSYVEQGDQASNTPLTMLITPDSAAYFEPAFVPKSDTATLKFTVPFEKNKSEYKEEDLIPFINSMNAPDFIINGLYITAYSSIEGNQETNEKLQRKRSENIIKALGKMQKSNAITNVKTSDSWELFKMTMEDTEFKNLTKMSKEEAINEINTTPGLSDKLEPYLSKQRFGEIVMTVSYDISGAKEEKYSIAKFNQAVKKGDVEQALKIQYYIAQKIREKKYSKSSLVKLEIPMDAKFSGLLNNQIVYNYYFRDSIPNAEDYAKINEIASLDPNNKIVTYNKMYCSLKLDSTLGDSKAIAEKQAAIDGMYKTNVPEKPLNKLNTEWQFKVISAVDTGASAQPTVQACIGRIKSFFNIKESNKENNLKLAYIFARFRDYPFAANLLSEFVKDSTADEQLLFAYISFAAHVPDMVFSKTFATALEKAERANHNRYCKLFGEPYLSFQVLDNPLVKEYHNKVGCQ
jgi:hypothetical protein